MTQYYWKVFDSRGSLIIQTCRHTNRVPGRQLRRDYPTRHGYSVRRVTVTVRKVAQKVAPTSVFARAASVFRALFG